MENLNEFTCHSFNELVMSPNRISDKPGVYCWVYVPSIDASTPVTFKKSLDRISKVRLRKDMRKDFNGLSVSISHDGFPTGQILPISSKKKEGLDMIAEDHTLRILFSRLLRKASVYSNVMYIGKADNLLERVVRDHVGKKTSLFKDAKACGIQPQELYVNIAYDDELEPVMREKMLETNLCDIVEEIVQRIAIPGFVERRG